MLREGNHHARLVGLQGVVHNLTDSRQLRLRRVHQRLGRREELGESCRDDLLELCVRVGKAEASHGFQQGAHACIDVGLLRRSKELVNLIQKRRPLLREVVAGDRVDRRCNVHTQCRRHHGNGAEDRAAHRRAVVLRNRRSTAQSVRRRVPCACNAVLDVDRCRLAHSHVHLVGCQNLKRGGEHAGLAFHAAELELRGPTHIDVGAICELRCLPTSASTERGSGVSPYSFARGSGRERRGPKKQRPRGKQTPAKSSSTRTGMPPRARRPPAAGEPRKLSFTQGVGARLPMTARTAPLSKKEALPAPSPRRVRAETNGRKTWPSTSARSPTCRRGCPRHLRPLRPNTE